MDEKDRIYRKVKSIIRQNGRSSYIGEDDFVSLSKYGIIINFHIKNPRLDIENIFRVVRRGQKIIRDRLGYNLEKLRIDIYNSREEMRQGARSKSIYASWIAGIYDGNIRMVSERGNEEPEAIYVILTHEIIHAAVSEMSKGRCPYWLDEGLAVYLSQNLSDQYRNELIKAVKEDKIFPLEAMEGSPPVDMEEHLRQLVYSEASSITEYLIESCGWDMIESIIRQSCRRDIKPILMDLGQNYYVIEQSWKRWLKGKNA